MEKLRYPISIAHQVLPFQSLRYSVTFVLRIVSTNRVLKVRAYSSNSWNHALLKRYLKAGKQCCNIGNRVVKSWPQIL